MVLGRALEDADGVTHPMTGLLGHVTSFAKRRMNLGYRQARLLADAPIGRGRRDGARPRVPLLARWSSRAATRRSPSSPTARATPLGPSGARRGRVTGTFFHAIAAAEGARCSRSSSSASAPATPST